MLELLLNEQKKVIIEQVISKLKGRPDTQMKAKNDKIMKLAESEASGQAQAKTNIGEEKEDAADKEKVKQWLKEAKMGIYYDKFINQGFDDVTMMSDITEKDLIDMGVDKIGHRKKILKHAGVLAPSSAQATAAAPNQMKEVKKNSQAKNANANEAASRKKAPQGGT